MPSTLTLSRLRSLLSTDPVFIVDFLVENNPNEVADNIADLPGFERPVGLEGINRVIDLLLRKGREADVINLLSVNIDTDGMDMVMKTGLMEMAIRQGVEVPLGGGVASQRISNILATQAVALYNVISETPELADVEESENGMGDVEPEPAQVTQAQAAAWAAKKRKLYRTIGWGLLAVCGIVAVGLIIRYYKKN